MEPIHEVDIFRYFAGEIKSVQSTTRPNVLPQYRFEDNVYSHFFFENGKMGTIITSYTHSAVPLDKKEWSNTPEYKDSMGHDMTMILTFTRASIGVDFIKCRMMINIYEEWPKGSGGFRVVQDRIESYKRGGNQGNFFHDIDIMRWEFIHRCANDQPPVQDPLDIWKSHMVCLAAEQSVQEDFRRVDVDYTLPKDLRDDK